MSLKTTPSSQKKRPSAAQRRLARVRRAFDPEALKRICVQKDFSQYADRYDLEPSKSNYWRGSNKRFYYYKDNHADILAVAHLDHVQADGTCTITDTKDGPVAFSGALDDRLGAYVILELLPKLGITTDILLTTNEEQGASTASEFVTEKEYNWMIEFDRGGTDVVMYDYETKEYAALVEAAGARVGLGSYSDISVLEHLYCAGFNWGVGYQDYHSARSHAWLEDTFKMVSRFLRFYSQNHNMILPHDPYSYSRWAVSEGYAHGGSWYSGGDATDPTEAEGTAAASASVFESALEAGDPIACRIAAATSVEGETLPPHCPDCNDIGCPNCNFGDLPIDVRNDVIEIIEISGTDG